ncbi:hypothetical protein HanPI659440_Chr14g0525071 [Helianthus annuus]|nr:hypothetical protein HanPI659440_Chr14g0525071 [Helianthus annuus]
MHQNALFCKHLKQPHQSNAPGPSVVPAAKAKPIAAGHVVTDAPACGNWTERVIQCLCKMLPAHSGLRRRNLTDKTQRRIEAFQLPPASSLVLQHV